jgi:hypothetical protein
MTRDEVDGVRNTIQNIDPLGLGVTMYTTMDTQPRRGERIRTRVGKGCATRVLII